MLLRMLAALAVSMIVAFPLTPLFLRLLRRPLYAVTDHPELFLQTIDVAGAFVAAMRITFWSGLLIASPILVIILGWFLVPALKESEKRLAVIAGAIGLGLFSFGITLGYFYTLPFAMQAMFFMNTWLGATPIWTLDSYVAFTTRLLIAFGLAFEIPLALLILGRLGIIGPDTLRRNRRQAVVASLLLACVLTPPDVISQLLMSIPMLLLYEACIWILYLWEKKTP